MYQDGIDASSSLQSHGSVPGEFWTKGANNPPPPLPLSTAKAKTG